MLALIARPISRFWAQPLQYRRTLGVGAFLLALAHTFHMLDHALKWRWQAITFMPIGYQIAIGLGLLALLLMTPAALTSFDWMVQRLGKFWRSLHLLAVPALILAAIHTILIGSNYLGGIQWTATQKFSSIGLGVAVIGVLLVRSRQVWALFALERFYAASMPSREK
jgi:DMSO/TMAO reductase YedYZ heme-binding membrane subunit